MTIQSKEDCRAHKEAVQAMVEDERKRGERLYEPSGPLNRATQRKAVARLLREKYPRSVRKKRAQVKGTLRAWLWIEAKKKEADDGV